MGAELAETIRLFKSGDQPGAIKMILLIYEIPCPFCPDNLLTLQKKKWMCLKLGKKSGSSTMKFLKLALLAFLA